MKPYLILLIAAFVGLGATAQKDNKSSQQQTTLSTEQFVKNWYLKQDKKTNGQPVGIGKGTYLYLKQDKTYEAYIMKPQLIEGVLLRPTTELGTWKLNTKKRTLTLTSGKQVIVWNIQSVSDTELILENQSTKAVYTFTDKE